MNYKNLFITQNSYYFVHRHFIKFFEMNKSNSLTSFDNCSEIRDELFKTIKRILILEGLFTNKGKICDPLDSFFKNTSNLSITKL